MANGSDIGVGLLSLLGSGLGGFVQGRQIKQEQERKQKDQQLRQQKLLADLQDSRRKMIQEALNVTMKTVEDRPGADLNTVFSNVLTSMGLAREKQPPSPFRGLPAEERELTGVVTAQDNPDIVSIFPNVEGAELTLSQIEDLQKAASTTLSRRSAVAARDERIKLARARAKKTGEQTKEIETMSTEELIDFLDEVNSDIALIRGDINDGIVTRASVANSLTSLRNTRTLINRQIEKLQQGKIEPAVQSKQDVGKIMLERGMIKPGTRLFTKPGQQPEQPKGKPKFQFLF